MDAEEALEDLRTLCARYVSGATERSRASRMRSVRRRYGPAPIKVTDKGIGRCSPAVEAALYFCALEAVQNALKHAGTGAHVTVVVGRNRDEAYFTAADDGVGMVAAGASDGIGLAACATGWAPLAASSKWSPHRMWARPFGDRRTLTGPRPRRRHPSRGQDDSRRGRRGQRRHPRTSPRPSVPQMRCRGPRDAPPTIHLLTGCKVMCAHPDAR
jgi:hypothetical protein